MEVDREEARFLVGIAGMTASRVVLEKLGGLYGRICGI